MDKRQSWGSWRLNGRWLEHASVNEKPSMAVQVLGGHETLEGALGRIGSKRFATEGDVSALRAALEDIWGAA